MEFFKVFHSAHVIHNYNKSWISYDLL